MSKNAKLLLVGAAVLPLYQWLAVGPAVGLVSHLAFYLAHLFCLFVALYSVRQQGARSLDLFAVGYIILYLIFLVLTFQPLLLILFLILYAAFFHVPILVGYLFLFALSFCVFAPYSVPLFALSALLYTGLWCIARQRRSSFAIGMYLLGCVLFVSTLLPLLYLFSQTSFQDLGERLRHAYVREALGVSLLSSTISTGIVLVLGVPLGYVMARWRFVGYSVADTLIDVPILIPQPVVGIALLVVLGPNTLLGGFLEEYLGLPVAGGLAGIVAAQVFVSSPFLVRAAMTAFQGVDERLENVAQTLGATPLRTFVTVTLPLASKGIFYGCILTWARAVSEFGAVSIIAHQAGSAPALIYDEFTQRGLQEARPLSVLLVLVCLWAFVCLRALRSWSPVGIAHWLWRGSHDPG